MSKATFSHPRVIWLQPWCAECQERVYSDGRMWCENDEWNSCEECGRKAIRYVMQKLDRP
jgi:hypothetical protein